ncbi:hypothetical protein B0T24DRAFT_596618 [Lasiosphaeria ovina]|uniref:Uncharacterized protein n=1 Tax=Lasiosphaeria ovina TaxID=92902 RepID=A0AAE0JYH8_9PEZI|nr:hypothetical protein B0T24DRAFT_596618 [Lasiosphaeria ovina]
MASPPYACPRHILKGVDKPDEEELHQQQFFLRRVVHGAHGWRPAMKSKWEVLVDFVNKLASSTSLRPWDTLSLTTQELLRRLLGGSAKPYYDAPDTSSALMQAWLWYALDDNLFSDLDKWATPAITPEERGESGVYAENEFHYWRIFTIRMMMNEELGGVRMTIAEVLGTNAAPHTSIDRLADRLMGKLAEIIDEAESPLSTLEYGVRRTARSAVFTDLAILRAWPHVMIAWRLPNMASAADMQGHPFRESPALQYYDDMFESKGDSIDFVVSPGIFESGQPITRYYEGIWVCPIRVAINGSLDDTAAGFRSFIM